MNLPYNAANSTPRYLSKKNEGLYLSKNLYASVFLWLYSSLPQTGNDPQTFDGRVNRQSGAQFLMLERDSAMKGTKRLQPHRRPQVLRAERKKPVV